MTRACLLIRSIIRSREMMEAEGRCANDGVRVHAHVERK